MRLNSTAGILAVAITLLCGAQVPAGVAAQYDADAALALSQSAIGRTLGDHRFTDRLDRPFALRELDGRPYVISMIFTSCHHVCPLTTRHLQEAVRAGREVLGDTSFEVLTIGFDAQNDTPDAMRAFSREQRIDDGNWRFLSTDSDTIGALSEELGFQYFPSPRGFDHINQVTVIDRAGRVYRQVYGVKFELPWLVEPLKELVLNRPGSDGHLFAGLVDRVRLFCTVYDPTTGRYEFDNSLFFQIAIGFIIIVSVFLYLWHGTRPSRPG